MQDIYQMHILGLSHMTMKPECVGAYKAYTTTSKVLTKPREHHISKRNINRDPKLKGLIRSSGVVLPWARVLESIQGLNNSSKNQVIL